MLFNSQPFILAFLPIVLILYYGLAERKRARQAVVVAASLIFYGWWDIRFVPLLVALTVANWLIARAYGASGRNRWITLGIVLNLATLGVCKYTNFLAGNVAELFGIPFTPWDIVLPLGISFFVFQKLSYLIDLRRGDRHIYPLLDFAMFVTFFPQLIAGPIVRHNEIIGQFALPPRRPEMWENIAKGFVLFLIGLVKKAEMADTLAHVVDPLFHLAATGPLNAREGWAAALTYTLQIYFDFSGYSDMAIGLALMFGLRIPFNFDAPYRAVSIRDFWRRWHMTLSRFLRDYLYIPLGGNRRGGVRQAINVVVTMLLGGLWHGAAWNFVAWGGLHGVALAVNGAWDRAGLRMPRLLGWALTLVFVMAGWVLFRAPDFPTAGRVLAAMAGWNGIGHFRLNDAALIAIAVVVALAGPTSQRAALELLRPRAWLAVPIGVAMVAILLVIGGQVPNAFIYFQF
jgi:alginate O-acetyltransferase complex protein AlgI